jgi:hypothetical protein
MEMGDNMVHILIRHKVKDLDKWKKVFDEHLAFRKAGGEKGSQVFHNIDNTSEVITFLMDLK